MSNTKTGSQSTPSHREVQRWLYITDQGSVVRSRVGHHSNIHVQSLQSHPGSVITVNPGSVVTVTSSQSVTSSFSCHSQSRVSHQSHPGSVVTVNPGSAVTVTPRVSHHSHIQGQLSVTPRVSRHSHTQGQSSVTPRVSHHSHTQGQSSQSHPGSVITITSKVSAGMKGRELLGSVGYSFHRKCVISEQLIATISLQAEGKKYVK